MHCESPVEKKNFKYLLSSSSKYSQLTAPALCSAFATLGIFTRVHAIRKVVSSAL